MKYIFIHFLLPLYVTMAAGYLWLINVVDWYVFYLIIFSINIFQIFNLTKDENENL